MTSGFPKMNGFCFCKCFRHRLVAFEGSGLITCPVNAYEVVLDFSLQCSNTLQSQAVSIGGNYLDITWSLQIGLFVKYWSNCPSSRSSPTQL